MGREEIDGNKLQWYYCKYEAECFNRDDIIIGGIQSGVVEAGRE